MLTKIDYILSCKEKLNKFQKVNVILFTFFDLRLHLGFNSKYRKKSNYLENPHAQRHSQTTLRSKRKQNI